MYGIADFPNHLGARDSIGYQRSRGIHDLQTAINDAIAIANLL